MSKACADRHCCNSCAAEFLEEEFEDGPCEFCGKGALMHTTLIHQGFYYPVCIEERKDNEFWKTQEDC